MKKLLLILSLLYDYEGEDIGIRKIRVGYIVDVKYELK
jgi:hypothetical protein